MDVMIWRGWGFLVFLIPLPCVAIGHLFAGGSFNLSKTWDAPFPHLMHAAGFVAAGVILWFVGRRLNGSAYSDEGGDGGGTHDYFFIRMEYWGVLYVVLAVLWYFNPTVPKRSAASPDTGRPAARQVTGYRR